MPELIRSVVSRMRIYVKDRRRSPRLRVRLLFSASVCRSKNGNGVQTRERLLKGHTRDIGANGLGLNVPQIHLDGHHLATEGSELELRLELPGGAVRMRVVPRRYERLDEPELGCIYLVGVQIAHIEEEDRGRYLSFIAQGVGAVAQP
jgi:hypothetical protein